MTHGLLMLLWKLKGHPKVGSLQGSFNACMQWAGVDPPGDERNKTREEKEGWRGNRMGQMEKTLSPTHDPQEALCLSDCVFGESSERVRNNPIFSLTTLPPLLAHLLSGVQENLNILKISMLRFGFLTLPSMSDRPTSPMERTRSTKPSHEPKGAPTDCLRERKHISPKRDKINVNVIFLKTEFRVTTGCLTPLACLI